MEQCFIRATTCFSGGLRYSTYRAQRQPSLRQWFVRLCATSESVWLHIFIQHFFKRAARPLLNLFVQ